jgi:hypothetical protein
LVYRPHNCTPPASAIRQGCRNNALENEQLSANCARTTYATGIQRIIGASGAVKSGDEAALDERLAAINGARWRRELEPYFAARFRNASRRCPLEPIGQHVAVLLVGALRTWVEPAAQAEFAELFSQLRRRYASLSVFAVVNTRQNERYHSVDAEAPRGHARERGGARMSGRELEARLRDLGASSSVVVEHNFEHRAYPDAWRACELTPRRALNDGLSPQAWQFVKVDAAARLMRWAEEASGVAFSVVIRLRPDVCVRSASRFLSFALPRTHCSSRFPWVVHDAIAVLPRWATEAYASYWRSSARCDDAAWAAEARGSGGGVPVTTHTCKMGQGGLQTFMLLAAGVPSVEMNRFWPGGEPLLRRQAGCTPFAGLHRVS